MGASDEALDCASRRRTRCRAARRRREASARTRGGLEPDVDDAHAVGQVVDDPDLRVGPRGHRDRLHAHRHRSDVRQASGRDVEDLEPSVRRVHREETRAVGREREWSDLTALERDKSRCRSRCGNRQEQERDRQDEADPVSHLRAPLPFVWSDVFPIARPTECREAKETYRRSGGSLPVPPPHCAKTARHGGSTSRPRS